MSYWIYYIIAVLTLFHPHLWQKLGMLYDYFSKPGYKFWTTFSSMDLFDLILHAAFPIAFFLIGLSKQRKIKK